MDILSAVKPLLVLGIIQIIHLGYEIKVWEDPWIPTSIVKSAPSKFFCSGGHTDNS